MSNTPKTVIRSFFNCSLLLFLAVLSSFTPVADSLKTAAFKFRTIVIDPGHGGKDPGASGSFSTEKSVALSIGKKLRQALAEDMPAIKVIMTRDNDTFIPLGHRAEIANAHNANLFISIHCDSSPEGTGWSHKGPTVLVYALKRSKEQYEAVRENASITFEKDYKTTYASYDENNPTNRIIYNLYMQKYRKQSILFGDLISSEFKYADNRKCSVKEQSVLVLAHSGMPAVLVETGYINNKQEEEYLNSEEGQDAIVQSILHAIKAYKKQVSL
jgi:N-acetylmuramoyl-L-alanine amidase